MFKLGSLYGGYVSIIFLTMPIQWGQPKLRQMGVNLYEYTLTNLYKRT